MTKPTGVMRSTKKWLEEQRQKNPQSYVAAERAGGTVLIADALVGLENPLDGAKTRPGIWGRFVILMPILAFALVWYLLAGSIGSAMDEASATEPARATVTSVTEYTSTDSHNRPTTYCSLFYTYETNGATRKSSPSYSSSEFCRYQAGDTIGILYDPADPGVTKLARADFFTSFTSIFRWIPLFMFSPVILGQVVGILVDIAQIGVGIWLLRRASRDASALPDGFELEELTNEMRAQLIPIIMALRGDGKWWKKAADTPEHSDAPARPGVTPDDVREFEEFQRWRQMRGQQ